MAEFLSISHSNLCFFTVGKIQSEMNKETKGGPETCSLLNFKATRSDPTQWPHEAFLNPFNAQT